jgi:hypothetical protein
MGSGDDEAPRGVRERLCLSEMGEDGAIEERPALPRRRQSTRRSLTAPVVPERRPQLNQFSSTSEEFIQKTREGFLDFRERGRVTLQQAGDGLTGLRERLLNQPECGQDSYDGSPEEPSDEVASQASGSNSTQVEDGEKMEVYGPLLIPETS